MEGGCIIFHIITNNEDIFYNCLSDFLYCQNVRIYVDSTRSTIGENSVIHAYLYIDKDVLDNKIIKK